MTQVCPMMPAHRATFPCLARDALLPSSKLFEVKSRCVQIVVPTCTSSKKTLQTFQHLQERSVIKTLLKPLSPKRRLRSLRSTGLAGSRSTTQRPPALFEQKRRCDRGWAFLVVDFLFKNPNTIWKHVTPCLLFFWRFLSNFYVV